ncbi:ankyrin repeat domain-containing protein 49 [Aethina tumida]|uniref:ankyrin repeat domain-containing protein 49 n=1 Tax=Aethina tumida TaxID=116153 RepID=UPI00096ADC9E|nr:ankyrin repeat domain-containing protein 49 [Aethina tumida]
MSNDGRFLMSGWEDDLDDIDSSRNPQDKNENEILEAAEKGNLNKIKELLKIRMELVNIIDRDKYTPLHRACSTNQKEVALLLIENGADVDAKTDMGWTPLHSCCHWNSLDCANILLQHGADVNAQSEGGQTPLHVAACHGASYGIVEILLMHPYIKPNIKNKSDETAMDIAKRSSKFYNIFDMADTLLSNENLELLK